MKKLFWIFLTVTLFAAAIFCIGASANGSKTTVGDLTFTEYDTYCAVTGCNTSASGSITIPSSVNFSGTSLPVTSIRNSAFSDCSKLTSVTIPDSVTSIGDNAFKNCGSLTNVTILDGVTSIGHYAFSDCSSLTSVTIPDSVTSIGDNAFRNCSSLTSVTIPDSVTLIGRYAFYGCNSLESITVPFIGGSNSSNKFIGYIFGASSYSNNSKYVPSSLKEIVISDKCTIIPQNAFYNCSSLTNVTIPDSVTSIGNNTFYKCRSLTSVTIPDSVTSIGDNAFYECNSLAYNEYENALYLGNANNPYVALFKAKNTAITTININEKTRFIYVAAFSNCNKLTSVTIPDGVTSIGSSAFSGCSSLESINIPFIGGNNLSNGFIGYIFGSSSYSSNNNYVPTSLKEIIISGKCTAIPDYAFYGCSSLTNVTIPDSVTSIGDYAFSNCSFLTNVSIPDSVLSIGQNAFNHCSGLTSITILDGVTSIGNYAFRGCSGLTSVTIPDSVTSIGNYAFSYCSGLIRVTIPDGVTSIGDYTFGYCSKIISVMIPESVSSIGDYVFHACDSLKYVLYLGDQTQWNQISIESNNMPLTSANKIYNPKIIDGIAYALNDTYSTVICAVEDLNGNIEIKSEIECDGITLPVVTISESAFSSCNGITSITIPGSVTSIDSSAFSNCSSLTSVIIPDNVTSISKGAFYLCSSLRSITLPFIGGSDFDNRFLGYIFGASEYADNYYYVPGTLNEIIISNKCTTIPSNAFYECISLTNVVISNSVASIGDSAFYCCRSITSVMMPESIMSIGEGAFSGCGLLHVIYAGDQTQWKQISIGNNNHNITNGAILFETTNTTIIDGITYVIYDSYSIAACADKNLTGDIIVPDEIEYNNAVLPVTSISDYAFYNCSNLTSVTLPDSIKSINQYVFYDCYQLKSMTIPDGVTSIGDYAFYNCHTLKSVTIPDSVTSIGNNAFYECSGLTSMTIPDGVTSIGNYAFLGCRKLTSVTIPNSVTSIGSSAFCYCSSLTSVTIPDSVTSIGNSAFYYCSGLTSVTIGNSVTSIGDSAFYNCNSLTNVIIGDGVAEKYIRSYAFYGCSSLNRVKYTGTPEQWKKISIESSNTPLLNATICYKTTLSATADIGNISIEPSGELFTHDEIKLKADNLLNYSFIGWFDGEKIVSTSTAYTFEITGDTVLTAKFEAVTAPVTVTVNCENGAEYTVTNNTSGGDDIFVGDSITIAAKDASKVLQWQNASGKVLGRGGSLTITVGGDTEITLIYKAEGAGQAYVQFVSGSGQVFSAGLYGSEDPISFPVVPTKLGYSFDGWVIDGTDTEATEDNIKSLFSSNKSLTVKPSYTELTTEFTVTVKYSGVNREDVVSSERIGSGFSVEAPEISGFVFQNWTDETGKILSYKNNYYVQVSKDITLIAVYGDEAPVALPVITISGISKVDENGTHKMTASATRSIPDGYELVEHGVLYARDVDGLDETTFVYGTPGVSKYISNKTMQNGVVKLNVKVDNDDVVVSMRGYMILKKNGVLSIYYTDIVSGKYGA